jgi:hypothetical protein
VKQICTAILVICLAGAAMALWRQRLDAAFVIATIGILAWFLRYRSELKQSLVEDQMPPEKERETNSSNEDS